MNSDEAEYLRLNRASWDERAPAHAASAMYDLERYVADREHLSSVVRFDLPLLGDVLGLRGIHLQCHIGTETLSLHRLGARMTGLDFSPASLAEARRLAAATGSAIDFIEADVYDAVRVAGAAAYDLVFTGIGALCWLPRIRPWAAVVAGLLRPGGRLFLREGHPMLWTLDDVREDGLLVAEFPYVERLEPNVWDDDSSYVETEVRFAETTTHEWNHGLGDLVSALLAEGMEVTGLVEHDSVPWRALPGMAEDEHGEYRLADRPWRLAASYTLQAVKRT